MTKWRVGMQFFDNDVLIRNIKQLMENNRITQSKLGEILGMSQSNVSKALKEDEKKMFTLNQVIGIAKHFNVSIDKLIGNENTVKSNLDLTDIATFLIQLIENDEVCIFDYPLKDTRGYTVVYHAFYFPPRWYMAPSENNGTRCRCFSPINKYIDQYLQINEVFKAAPIDSEVQKNMKAELVKQLSKTKPVQKDDYAPITPINLETY